MTGVPLVAVAASATVGTLLAAAAFSMSAVVVCVADNSTVRSWIDTSSPLFMGGSNLLIFVYHFSAELPVLHHMVHIATSHLSVFFPGCSVFSHSLVSLLSSSSETEAHWCAAAEPAGARRAHASMPTSRRFKGMQRPQQGRHSMEMQTTLSEI
jgi:hypothetical protein